MGAAPRGPPSAALGAFWAPGGAAWGLLAHPLFVDAEARGNRPVDFSVDFSVDFYVDF